jgi:transposase
MLNVERETDPERLRQIAKLALSDNERLVSRIVKLTRELAELRGKDQQEIALEMQHLKEQLAELNDTLYGRSSERRTGKQKRGQKEKPPQRGHGPTEQKELERLDKTHALDEADQAICPACGGRGLEEWEGQEEQSEEIDIIERKFVIVVHHKQKYRCCDCHSHVETAPGPVKLIPGGRYSTDFAIAVAVDKYCDHQPLERQTRTMKREGLVVSSQTLWDQLAALTVLLKGPLYDALGRFVLSSAVVFADETKWRMLTKDNRKTWYLWGVSCLEAAYYKILDSRSQEAGGELLGDFDGTVVCDGYDVYPALARGDPEQLALSEQEPESGGSSKRRTKKKRMVIAGCWSHARSKFIKAEKYEPEACKEIIDLIGKLFDVERQVPFVPAEGDELAKQLGLRAELRERVSKPIVDEIYAWVAKQEGKFLPRSTMGKAVSYLVNQRKPLEVHLTDPRVPIHNNLMERGLRGPVLGRKNFYGTKSKRGAEAAAVFYSIIESCKLVGADPKKYLRYVTYRLLNGEEQVPLPHEYAKLLAEGKIVDPKDE